MWCVNTLLVVPDVPSAASSLSEIFRGPPFLIGSLARRARYLGFHWVLASVRNSSRKKRLEINLPQRRGVSKPVSFLLKVLRTFWCSSQSSNLFRSPNDHPSGLLFYCFKWKRQENLEFRVVRYIHLRVRLLSNKGYKSTEYNIFHGLD